VIRLPAEAIEEIHEGRSLMPDGAIDELTRGELIDLVRFLSELGKAGKFAVGTARVARSWEALRATPEARHRLNRTSFDTAATDDPALTWQPAFSLVSGPLPWRDLPQIKPHAETEPTTFVRCAVQVSNGGPIGVRVNGTRGLECWVDGKPTPIRESLVIPLPAGRHRLTVAINRTLRQQPLRLELYDVDDSPGRARWAADTKEASLQGHPES